MLEVKHLRVTTRSGKNLLNDVSFLLKPGSIVGLTGESGAGKTTIIKAIMGITNKQFSVYGKVAVDGTDLRGLSQAERRSMCGSTLGFIPQIPMTAFDPRLTIRSQLRETFRYKLGGRREEMDSLAEHCLKRVNLFDTERILKSRPADLSGGMLQRISFAFQLGLKPKYILADEPTSALDEENSNTILALLKQQKETSGILLVSHDYHAFEKIADQIVVLHSGESAHYNNFSELIQTPAQEWTRKFVAYHNRPEKGGFVWTASQ